MNSQRVVDDFHRFYWGPWPITTEGETESPGPVVSWLGHRCLKNPMDLWVYQQIIYDTHPDLIIETGTWSGGTAYFLAGVCELVNRGIVISIDLELGVGLPKHHRLAYCQANTGNAEEIAKVIPQTKSLRVMAILDSDHRKDHVDREIRIFSELVTVGNYLIVEDTNLNGNPVASDHGPGPSEAVADFINSDDRYVVDKSRESLLFTYNPNGYLLRVR